MQNRDTSEEKIYMLNFDEMKHLKITIINDKATPPKEIEFFAQFRTIVIVKAGR